MPSIIPTVFADITINTDQGVYNLGNRVKASASILHDKNFEGLFKLTLSCDNYNLQYFLTPVSLESNFRTSIAVPEIIATSSMLGNCNIIGNLATNDNKIIDEESSNSFNATDQLNVLPVKSKITSLPGDNALITGVVNNAFGHNILKASTKVILDNGSYEIDTIDGIFNLTLKLPNNIKSGKHTIEIYTSDSKGNSGGSSVELEITVIPSYIKLELSRDIFLPGSTMEILASLYDQANELVNDTLGLELTSPTGDKVFTKVVRSNEKINYEFSQYSGPGIYYLVSTYNSLETEARINITEVKDVKIKYENETVLIENTGNIPFIEELTFILESELKKYPITKEVSVEPGKLLRIDMSKEVPQGVYDIIVPIINETVQNIVDSSEEILSAQLLEHENVLAANVTIHDNRPAYKKVASGLASISGALVGAEGVLTKSPLTAPMILVGIILILVFRYGRKPIMRLLKRKKNKEEFS